MAEYINNTKQAIEVLEKIRDQRKTACRQSAVYEATGLNYAIEVVRRISGIDVKDNKD